MTTFVLVHGAWHGGWCWQRVTRRLQNAGHVVYAPSLTGLADRSHMLSETVDLSTHIADVVNLIRWEDLSDVVLCGHSYGGMVVTGAADQLHTRVRALVYLDAFVPRDGESSLSLRRASPDSQHRVAKPAPPAANFGLTGDDATWVDAKTTPQPLAAGNEPIRLSGASLSVPKTYVLATGWHSNPHFADSYERALSDPHWIAVTVDGSHDLMIDRPDDVVAILLGRA